VQKQVSTSEQFGEILVQEDAMGVKLPRRVSEVRQSGGIRPLHFRVRSCDIGLAPLCPVRVCRLRSVLERYGEPSVGYPGGVLFQFGGTDSGQDLDPYENVPLLGSRDRGSREERGNASVEVSSHEAGKSHPQKRWTDKSIDRSHRGDQWNTYHLHRGKLFKRYSCNYRHI